MSCRHPAPFFVTDYCLYTMTRSTKTDGAKVYEIGYLLVSSIPEEKVSAKVDELKAIISAKKAEMIAEEAPVLETLAYMMMKKIGAKNHRFTQGYFGWVKFAVEPESIIKIKEAFDADNDVLRFLLITTPRENTYLGKRSSAVVKEEIVAPAAEVEKPVDETPKEA